MFPESFAENWINQLTSAGESVLDPFSGRGTTALSALLMNRKAIATDVNDVAYCLTKAKSFPPTLDELLDRIRFLESGYYRTRWVHRAGKLPEFFHHAYSPQTLCQLVYLRTRLAWRRRRTDAMIAALTLGALHGELNANATYLSNQMPRTISTKPGYSVAFWRKHNHSAPPRDVFDVIGRAAYFRYESVPPCGQAVVLNVDMRKLPQYRERFGRTIQCAITSPPYLNVTDFGEDQWLRLWFLGHGTHPTTSQRSPDDRHVSVNRYESFMSDMWRMFGRLLGREADIVIRIGSKVQDDKLLEPLLVRSAKSAGRKLRLVSVSSSAIRGKQTRAFRPTSVGCSQELDFHFRFVK